MPENTYFRQPETQKMLLDVLFVWCKLNPDVGYRQGMHEVLAPIVWVVERDAIDPNEMESKDTALNDENQLLQFLLGGQYIEHDAFTLFGLIMQTAKSFYEPGGHEPRSTKDPSKPRVERESPMIKRSRFIFQNLLPKVDPELSDHLEKIDIMPQIFLM
jgi:TBC1 domain family protein 5